MSAFDRFLSSIKLNDDEDLDDERYLDEDVDDFDDNRLAKRFIPREEEDDDVAIFEEDQAQRKKSSRRSGLLSKPSKRSMDSTAAPGGPSKVSAFRPRKAVMDDDIERNNFSVCVIRPKSMEDALQIAQMLIAHCTVILNLEGLDLSISQRIFDFASGACCASRGSLDKISNYIFVLTPHDVDITGEFQKILTGTFDPGVDLDLGDDL